MVGATVFLIAGILFFDRYCLASAVLWGMFLICCAVSAVTVRQRAGVAYVAAAVFFFGGAVVSLRRFEPVVPRDRTMFMQLAVEDIPVHRDKYSSVPVRITGYDDNGTFRTADERAVLRFDNALSVHCGDRIECLGRVRPFSSDRASYADLMTRRGFVGTLFLSASDTVRVMRDGRRTLHAIVSERLSRLGLSDEAAAVVGAVGAGARGRIAPELRQAYSRSGASHVLAVSGLHVGIVFMLANALLWWLPAFRYGHIVRNAAVLIPVWLYAAAAGLSPSVVRAAVMFSALQVASASSSSRNGLNILAAAAFCMLVFDPDMLFDISFRLSFIAVAAIITVGIPLFRLVGRRNIAIRLLWDTTVVGLVSGIATAPLVSNVFGVVPLAGVLINPVIILCAYVIVGVSVLWIVMPFAFAAPAAAAVLNGAVGVQNFVVTRIAACDAAWVEYSLSGTAAATAYIVLAAIISLCASIERKKSVHLPE